MGGERIHILLTFSRLSVEVANRVWDRKVFSHNIASGSGILRDDREGEYYGTRVALAEWLRRVPAKYMGFPRGEFESLRCRFFIFFSKYLLFLVINESQGWGRGIRTRDLISQVPQS